MRPSLIVFFLIFSQTCLAEIYKCKNKSGKVTYSESPCDANYSILDLEANQNVLDSSYLRNKAQQNRTQRTKQEYAASESENADLMSPYEIDTRIRELQITKNDSFSMYEEREDANTEYQYIYKKQPRRLSYEVEIIRKNLKVDLTSLDVAKRRQALIKLRSIYQNY